MSILKRSHTSSGNRKKFTYAFWYKQAEIPSGNKYFFSLSDDAGANWDESRLLVNSSSQLRYVASDLSVNVLASKVQRDSSAWKHIMVVGDSTLQTSFDRVKLYVNGIRVNDLSTTDMPARDANFAHNFGGNILVIGSYGEVNPQFDIEGELFDIFNVDGQALTPDVFGFYKDGNGYISAGTTQTTDFRPGQWVPKKPSVIKNTINNNGGFGVNGFYLPMNDSSNFGADFHCDPNSIITLQDETAAQPKNGAPDTTDAYVSQLRSDPYAANLVLAVPGISTSTGPELVTNGDFSNGTTGWTLGSATGTLSVVLGELFIEYASTNGAYCTQTITTEVGKSYKVSVTSRTTTTNQPAKFSIGTASNTSDLTARIDNNDTTNKIQTASFVATSTTTHLTLGANFTSDAYFDNVSVREEATPVDYSADIKGSGTNKTLTVNGGAGIADIPSYYGSALSFDGTGDYFSVPNTSDFRFTSEDFTIEAWIKTNDVTDDQFIFSNWNATDDRRAYTLWIEQGTPRYNAATDGTGSGNGAVDPGNAVVVYNDEWAHVAFSKEGSTNRVFLNGVCVGINTTGTDIYDNTTDTPLIGGEGGTGTRVFNGYIQDLRVYKGVAKYKGGFDVPKPYTPVGIGTWRAVPDCTANNFATLNTLASSADVTYSNGNLTCTHGTSATRGPSYATMGVTQAGVGRYYWEYVTSSTGTNNALTGLVGLGPDYTDKNYPGFSGGYGIGYYVDGNTYSSGGGSATITNYGDTYTTNDIIGVALDMETNNGSLTFYKNGVSQGVAATGLGTFLTNGEITSWIPGFGDGSSSQDVTHHVNFGQNPTFSGQVSAGATERNSDENGIGEFRYAPPSGFLALCEDNLPAPAVADPGDYFKTVLYTGDSNGGRSITGVGFKPDLVWIKNRDFSHDHMLNDSVRGAGLRLASSWNGVEQNEADGGFFNSFDTDGFSLGSGVRYNSSSYNYVAWCWKAGGAAVSNTDGSIASQVSVNQDAGFSIVTYTSTGSNTATETVGHGLNKTPNMIILKNRSAAVNWRVYHSGINDAGKNSVTLNSTEAAYVFWPSVGSDTFGLANSTTTGQAAGTGNQNIVAYCWAEIEGFSKFGSYVGNGSADGAFVYCGFKPAFVMLKASSTTGNWCMIDNARNSTNPTNFFAVANSSAAGDDTGGALDFVSNGFKLRLTSSNFNGSGTTYIFAAFAESPFKTANAK